MTSKLMVIFTPNLHFLDKIFVRYDENDTIFHMTDELQDKLDDSAEECYTCLKAHPKLKHWYL